MQPAIRNGLYRMSGTGARPMIAVCVQSAALSAVPRTETAIMGRDHQPATIRQR
jgi:hypothetical protein